ncbi:MAG: cation:proton antiporter [Magnetococcales bacterium]|nr:cation:proton antiporter [Magnetococcales bacterium]MBF0114381.1 cation:proton antiporter [Magnetococcales bacterium]
MSTIALFFVHSLLLVCLPYLLWRLLKLRNWVPLVVVQILVGIMLGPAVLGRIAPAFWPSLFTAESLTTLSGISWLAGVMFAFLTGLHLQPAEFRGLGRSFTVVSISSIFTPTLLGVLAGWLIAAVHPEAMGTAASGLQFAAAIGVCIGVTALPVLGAILRESGLINHRIGRLSLGIAAINDATLWVMLAFLLVGLPNRPTAAIHGFWLALVAIVYLLLMFFPIRLQLRHRIGAEESLSESGLILVCATIFSSALIAEWCGLHAILGGFVAGSIMPRRAAQAIAAQLEPITVMILLPFFFTRTGLTTYFDLFSSGLFDIFLIATVTSVIGKFLGTALPAHWMGEGWPVACALGTLMQTKGMMEVVVLTVLLEAQVLSATCFSGLLFMAIATTIFTAPTLRLTCHLTSLPCPSKANGQNS